MPRRGLDRGNPGFLGHTNGSFGNIFQMAWKKSTRKDGLGIPFFLNLWGWDIFGSTPAPSHHPGWWVVAIGVRNIPKTMVAWPRWKAQKLWSWYCLLRRASWATSKVPKLTDGHKNCGKNGHMKHVGSNIEDLDLQKLIDVCFVGAPLMCCSHPKLQPDEASTLPPGEHLRLKLDWKWRNCDTHVISLNQLWQIFQPFFLEGVIHI